MCRTVRIPSRDSFRLELCTPTVQCTTQKILTPLGFCHFGLFLFTHGDKKRGQRLVTTMVFKPGEMRKLICIRLQAVPQSWQQCGAENLASHVNLDINKVW